MRASHASLPNYKGLPAPTPPHQRRARRTGVRDAATLLCADGGGGARPAVQYIVLRRDLQETEGWPLGALVAQGSHAAVAAVAEHWDTPACRAYVAPDAIKRMTKAVLEVKGEPQLRGLAAKLEEGGAAHVLWVEQPENFPTCLATAPARKSTLAPFFKKCRLSSWHDVKATSGAQQAPEGT